jgi:hypothetical protein
MKLFTKVVIALSMMIVPLLSSANGTYQAGTVYVFNSTGYRYTNAYWNVRYNPASTTGRIGVGITPGQTIGIVAVSTTGNVGFSCYATPATVGAGQYWEWETLLMPILAGGNGAYVFANSTNGICGSISTMSSSAHLD